MHELRTFSPFHFGALFFFVATATMAHSFKEPSSEEKFAKADLIAIGTVLTTEGADVKRVRVRSAVTLKGNVDLEFDFTHTSYIAEMSSKCCSVGSLYVFFLEYSKDGLVPLRGRQSILMIENNTESLSGTSTAD